MAEKNTSVFSNLKRLFSTDIIVHNVGGSELKIVDSRKIQSTGTYKTNALVDRFTRLYMYNNRNAFNPNLNYQTLRIQLYTDYEAMDTDPIIASGLDILADESTLKNDMGELLTVKSSDENIQRVLTNLFYDILNIEFNLWSWIRNMLKYGDFFLKLEISEKFGVYNVLPYTVYHVVRHEGADPDNPTKVHFTINPEGIAASSDPNYLPKKSSNTIELDNYEVAHFRLLADTNYLPYGRSYIEPARKIYKQLALLEDAMLIHRIMRSAEKRKFFINVGNIPSSDVDQFMQKTINSMKKTPYVDPQTGQYNLKFNIQNMLEDFFIPVRGNDQITRIETDPGLNYDGIQDIDYLLRKLFAALKIPKAYFGYEGELQGKATLAAEDIRFARTVERVQRIVESELTKIALIHLYVQGYRGENLVNFELKLTSPSIIFEQEKVALLKEKVDLAQQMQDTNLFSTDYIYEHIFHLSEDEYMEMRDLIREDQKRKFRFNQIENEGNDPAKSGKSYGTPHDLASMYGRRSEATGKGANFGEVPPGYEDNPSPPTWGEPGPEGGRPRTRASVYGTNADPLGGRDRLGRQGMKGGFPSDNEYVMENLTTRKVLASLEKEINIFDNEPIDSQPLNEIQSSSLLSEDQLEDLGN